MREPSPLDVVVIGAGFVGLTTALTLTEGGHRVLVVERDPARVAALRQGRVPFHEPGVEEAWRASLAAGSATVAHDLGSAVKADAIFLCVGTPPASDGSVDLSHLRAAAADVAAWVEARPHATPTIVTKSTVPPGTARNVVLPTLAGIRRDRFGVASNPEFLREGSALHDARHPDRIVIGCMDERGRTTLRRLYAGAKCPVLETDPETAEATKYVANAFLATKVALSNEVANLCERFGVNVDEVMRGVGLDARIGPLFLRGGLGFGGSCFPKDVAGLQAIAREEGVSVGILDAVLRNNETQPLRAIELATSLVGPLAGKRVALLGLAFKPHTSDVRGTRALPIYRALREAGANVVCCDPVACDEFRALAGEDLELTTDARAAIEGADLAIVHTEWPEFRALTTADFRRMRRAAVVDGRRHLDGAALVAAGIDYRALGVGGEGKR